MGVEALQAGVDAIKDAVVDKVPAVRPDGKTWLAILAMMLTPVISFGGWAISQHTRTTVLETRTGANERRIDRVEDVVFEPRRKKDYDEQE